MNPAAVAYAASAVSLSGLLLAVLWQRKTLAQLRFERRSREAERGKHEAAMRELEKRTAAREARLAAVTASVRHAATVAGSLNVGACLWDKKGEALWSNPRWDETLGRAPAEALRTSLPAETSARLGQALLLRLEAEEEFELQAKDGRKLWLRLSVAPLSRTSSDSSEYMLGLSTDLSAEHEAGALLAGELERLETALAGGNLGVWEWNPGTDTCKWDERARQLFCLEEVAPTYDAWLACFHPDDLTAFETRLRSTLLGREPLRGSVRLRPEKAGPRTLLLKGAVLRDAKGKPERMVGVVADVTEEAKTREQLSLAVERLRLSLTGANDGVWEWRVDEDAFFMDEKWCALTGTGEATHRVTRTAFDRLLHPEDTLIVSGALAMGASGAEGKLDLEFRVAARNDRWVWLRWRGTVATRDEEGRTRTLCGTYADVTERRRTEEALRSSALLLRQMCQQMGIAAWRLDLPGFTFAWTEELDLLHSPPPDFVPSLENVLALYPPDSRRELTRAIEASTERKEPFDLEVRWLSADAGRWYRWTGYPVEERGGIREICGLVQDVTAVRETAAQRRELDSRLAELRQYEALSAITDDLAYDLNNLLGTLLGFQELCCEELPTGNRARGYVLEALRTSNRIHDIIRQVILLNRVKPSARIGLRPQVLVEELCERLAHTLPKTILLTTELDKTCPPISGDAVQLQQALLAVANQAAGALLGHGARLVFSLSAATVTLDEAAQLGLTLAGDFCRLRIEAERAGLTEAEWQKLFSHVARDPGFNLASARKALSQHQGLLRLLFKPECSGLCEIWLPLSRTLQKHPTADTPVPLGAGEEIWIVNEERFVARLAKMSLENSGYSGRIFRSAAEFTEALQEAPDRCKAVLLGNSLQGLTPLEFVSSARSHHPGLPAIAVGTLSDLAGAPGTYLLAEPFTASDLARTTYEALHPSHNSMSVLEQP